MPKILVVDDQEHVRLLYSEELNEGGYEVITAESGYNLLEKIEDEKPDLVILDIKGLSVNKTFVLASSFWPALAAPQSQNPQRSSATRAVLLNPRDQISLKIRRAP